MGSNNEYLGQIVCYDHLILWVGNAKQAATYYCVHMGFKPLAYRGLETGSRDVVSHVLKQNDIIFEFQSPLKPNNKIMSTHLQRHGDGVKDIAFTVDNIDGVVGKAKSNGAVIVKEIHSVTDDNNNGTVRMATVQAFGDTTHTFVERSKFKGLYLPNYKKSPLNLSLLTDLPKVDLKFVDHFAGVQEKDSMESVVNWYQNCLSFDPFFRVDENKLQTNNSSLRSVAMNSPQNNINFNIVEPDTNPGNDGKGKMKSQSQEFLDYYDGPGVHHIAIHSYNIIEDVKAMKARGLEFAETDEQYYQLLRERVKTSKVEIKEDLDVLQELNILLDFDDEGYLMQIFGKPVQDRPTLVIEIIERHNHKGYGIGNFKALFNSILAQQVLRGNV